MRSQPVWHKGKSRSERDFRNHMNEMWHIFGLRAHEADVHEVPFPMTNLQRTLQLRQIRQTRQRYDLESWLNFDHFCWCLHNWSTDSFQLLADCCSLGPHRWVQFTMLGCLLSGSRARGFPLLNNSACIAFCAKTVVQYNQFPRRKDPSSSIYVDGWSKCHDSSWEGLSSTHRNRKLVIASCYGELMWQQKL